MNKVLVIARHSPVPPSTGAAQRTSLLIRSISRRLAVDLVILSDMPRPPDIERSIEDATLIDYVQVPQGQRHTDDWRGRVVGLATRVRRGLSLTFGFQELPVAAHAIQIIARREQYEWIVVRYLSTFAQCGLGRYPNVIVDIDDMPAEAFRTAVAGRARHPGEWLYNRWKAVGLRRQTAKFASMCRHIWVPNPDHVQLFPNASCLPNIPFPYFPPEDADGIPVDTSGGVVMFVGLMGYAPNQDAVRTFVARVWQSIRRMVPDARFEVVGGGCPEDLRREVEACEGVHVMGYREDLARAYRECSVVVAPIHFGSGTTIKVLEAMFHGKPCVLSRFASRGQSGLLRDNENVMIAGDDREFAEKVVALLRDAELNRKIGAAGALAVRECCSFEKFDHEVQESMARLGSP